MEKLKVAIIGAGQIARTAHIPNYIAFQDEVEIVGISSRNIESAKEVASQFHVDKFYSDHIKMLEELKPDIVSVCTPNKFHCQIVCDALERGSNVLCEKPPAITVEEVEKMHNTAAKYHRLLSFGFHFRHSDDVTFLKKKITGGEFGEIYAGKVKWNRRRGIPGWGSFTDKEIQGGGPLIDIGVHMLDLAMYLMDYPGIDYVSGTAHQKIGKKKGVGLMGDWDPNKFTVEDSFFGFIKFKNGASINLETAFALNMKENETYNVWLFGDKLGARIFPLETYGEDGNRLTNISYPSHETEDLHYKCIANFVNACLGKDTLLVTSEQGVYIQKLICSLYESARLGKPVIMQ